MKKRIFIIASIIIAASAISIGSYVYLNYYKAASFHGIEFVRISSGTKPDFFIGKYEVTQRQYESIMKNNPSFFKGKPDNPVESVSQREMMEFCNRLSEVCGLIPYYEFDLRDRLVVNLHPDADGFRLPMMEEWSYAMQGESKTKYYWGDKMNGDYLWNEENSGGIMHPVGMKKPNTFGLYDLSGNAMEVCFANSEGDGFRAGFVGGDYTTTGDKKYYGSEFFTSKFILYPPTELIRNKSVGFRIVKNKI
jgi:hypothetical protein